MNDAPTATEVLENHEVLTLPLVAFVLELCYRKGARKGKPNPHLVRTLILAGKLRVVDDDQPVSRWTVSRAEVRRYLEGGTVRRIDRHRQVAS